MMEFIFDTARTVSDLLLRGVFTRHPGVEWIFTHGGGALPLLADRLEAFRSAFAGALGPELFGPPDAPSVQSQLRRLWFDMAGTPFPNQVPALVKAFGSDGALRQRLLLDARARRSPPPSRLGRRRRPPRRCRHRLARP